MQSIYVLLSWINFVKYHIYIISKFALYCFAFIAIYIGVS